MAGSDRCVSHLGRVGRPSLLDDKLAQRLTASLRAGNFVDVAARSAGLSRRTFSAWMLRGSSGKSADEPYRKLRDQVEQARAEGEVRNVARISAAAADSWRAAAWILERSYPERWGRPSARLMTGGEVAANGDNPTAVDPFAEADELRASRLRIAGPGK